MIAKKGRWDVKHFISMQQLSGETINHILKEAESIRKSPITINKQLFAANLFFEPSTRTKMSFEVAQKKIGTGNVRFAYRSIQSCKRRIII